VAVTIVLSIVAHSSTDVLVARTFEEESMPAWRDRLYAARLRLRRDRPAPSARDGEPGYPDQDGR
jgi:hypothetical protein